MKTSRGREGQRRIGRVSIGRVQEKVGRRRRFFPAWVLFLLYVLLVALALPALSGEQKVQAAADEDFQITVEVGYDGAYVSTREVPVRVNVTGREDFSGTAELLYEEQSYVLAHKKDFVLAAGETKEAVFFVKLPLDQAVMTARLVDTRGSVRGAISVDLVNGSGSAYLVTGILSDIDGKNYPFGAINGELLTLTPEDITTEKGSMGMLDIIMVDQFHLDSLGSTKLAALEDWVEDGGTLVLGAGSYYSQTLMSFSDEFLSGRVGAVEQWEYQRDEETSAVLSYCPLDFSDAEVVMAVDSRPLLYQIPRGRGSVLVSAVSLQLPSSVFLSLGGDLNDVIQASVSQESKRRVEEEMSSSYSYYITNALSQGNMGNIPKTSVYAVVLVVYIVLVGPVAYLILKKFDKRHYMWVLVPCCSLVFTGLIYLMGLSTRIQEPYMNYVTYLDYATERPLEKTYFSLTTPYNRSYDVVVEKDYRISQLRLYGHSFYQRGLVYSNYDVGFYEFDGGTTIELNKPSAFESFEFAADGYAAATGSYTAELATDREGNLTGTFTNNLGYDMDKVFLVSSGILTYVGPVADGETVSVNTAGKDTQIVSYDNGRGYYGTVLESAYDGYYREPEMSRKYYALSYFLGNQANYRTGETYFLGTVAGEQPNSTGSLVSQSELPNYGTVVPILPVELDTKGYTYVSSIDSYERAIYEGSNELPWSRMMYTPIVTIEYQFPDFEEVSVEEIQYSSRFNAELMGYGDGYFMGTVYFLNTETGEYDPIFTGGTEESFDSLAPYLTEDGCLVIRYDAEWSEDMTDDYGNYIGDSGSYQPVLSVLLKEREE